MADPEEAAARIPSCAADRSTVHSAAPASAAAATGAEAPTSLVNAAGAVPVNVAAAAAAASPLGPPGSSSAVGGQGAPVYTPYRLPPLLHPAGSSAFSPPPVSPATTTNAGFSLDPRFQAPHPSVPFGSGSAGGAGAGGRGSRPPPPPTHSLSAPTALGGAGSLNGGPGSTSDVPVHDPPPPQHQNPLDALMHLHAAAGGADTSEAALLALDAAAAAAANGGGGAGKEPPVPPKVVQKADRSCKKLILFGRFSGGAGSAGSLWGEEGRGSLIEGRTDTRCRAPLTAAAFSPRFYPPGLPPPKIACGDENKLANPSLVLTGVENEECDAGERCDQKIVPDVSPDTDGFELPVPGVCAVQETERRLFIRRGGLCVCPACHSLVAEIFLSDRRARSSCCREESVEGSDQQRITDLETKIGASRRLRFAGVKLSC